MEKQLQEIFVTHNISPHRNQGILIVPVIDQAQGIRVTKEILYKLVDKKTALFLSGGKTPKSFLTKMAEEGKLEVGVVGQVDERFGKRMHENANEMMFEQTGLLNFLKQQGVQFHSMLSSEKGSFERESLAQSYDILLRSLFTVYQRLLATLGVGSDGHIAGIAPNRFDFKNPLFQETSEQKFVSSFDDASGSFGQRITMTFLGLSMMDVLLPIVLGEDKKEALEKMFDDGKEEDIPARFLKRGEIASKTILITDQNI